MAALRYDYWLRPARPRVLCGCVTTSDGEVPKWSYRDRLESDLSRKRHVGSNPTLSANLAHEVSSFGVAAVFRRRPALAALGTNPTLSANLARLRRAAVGVHQPVATKPLTQSVARRLRVGRPASRYPRQFCRRR